MPSFHHEILVELFRANGELAAALLRSAGGISIDHARAESGSIDLSQVAPARYHADVVTLLQDGDGTPVAAIIVEVQRHIDRDKLLSWPVYVAALRAQHECAVVLLVIAPTPEVAAWAQRPIALGHPGFQLTPIAIGFDDVPRIRDRAAASQLPELAVLSAMAHPELEIAEAAIHAVTVLPSQQSQLYLDVILHALPGTVRQTLETRMIKGYEYQSDFARKYYSLGREEGEAKGREEGREEGLRAAVVALARSKLTVVSDRDLERIAAITEPVILTELITALGDARSAAESRAALDGALR